MKKFRVIILFVRNIKYNQWLTAIFYQETLEKTIFYGSVVLAEEPIIDKVNKLGRKVGDRFKESMGVLFDDYLGKPTDFQDCTSESIHLFNEYQMSAYSPPLSV